MTNVKFEKHKKKTFEIIQNQVGEHVEKSPEPKKYQLYNMIVFEPP